MKKKSARKASESFKDEVERIEEFLDPQNLSSFSDAHVTWAYDYSILRLYREFENLILGCLIAAINNNTTHLSNATGVSFPKHLTDEICEYIILGGGYFNFRGRSGLIETLKKFLDDAHYLVTIVKTPAYRDALERLCTLRNFAAHDSVPSKKQALRAIGGQRLASSGAWLKRQNRFQQIAASLKALADSIHQHAPY